MAKILVTLLLLLMTHPLGVAQRVQDAADQPLLAKVEVAAFEANGRFLGAPNVVVFESASGVNMSSRFHEGIAADLPYGTYRIEARLPWYFSDISYVRVYQPHVTIVVGLRFSTELPDVPPMLSGRVSGLSGEPKPFVKMVGVYEHISVESAINQDGGFSVGGLAPGHYILWIVGEKGVLASKALTIPYLGDPLQINVGPGVAPQ